VAREAAHWDPVLAWAANDLGAHFILSEGVVHVAQPAQAINAAAAYSRPTPGPWPPCMW
jgi:chaperone required for assembly of F1-ATPase